MQARPKPSRLFSLREWLSLDDAAKHLSIVFGEEVTRADVLRLALDRRLTLSVDFVNHADARKGRLVPLEQCPMMIMTRSLPALTGKLPMIRMKGVLMGDIPNLDKEIRDGLESGDMVMVPQAIEYEDGHFLLLGKEVVSISGIWDLPMKGAEALDVEHLYQGETGGPEVTLAALDGAFVVRDGIVCQIQADFEDNEYQQGSMAHKDKIEERIAREKLTDSQAEQLRREFTEQRRKFLEKRKAGSRAEHSYPAGGLPNDAVYVVRTTTLREFEQAILGGEQHTTRALGKREESTLLNIVGGLLGLLLGKTPGGKPQSVFGSQASVIDALVAAYDGKPGISTRTLQDKFAAAKRSLES